MLRLCNYCLERVGIYYEPESRPVNHTPIPGSPSPPDKLHRKNSSMQSLSVSTNTRESSIADIPDTLNITDDKSLNLKLQSRFIVADQTSTIFVSDYDPPLDHGSLKSAYEPCAEADEPEWVRNLNTLHERGEGGLFAPAQSATSNINEVNKLKLKSTSSTSCMSFEVRKDWNSTLLANDSTQPPISALFDAQTEAVLDHLFEREQISKTVWKPLLWSLSGEIVQIIDVDTLLRPKLINVLDYVHIKKLHVDGTPSVEVSSR